MAGIKSGRNGYCQVIIGEKERRAEKLEKKADSVDKAIRKVIIGKKTAVHKLINLISPKLYFQTASFFLVNSQESS